MRFLGMKVYPTPVLRPLWPFAVGGVITWFLINDAQDKMMQGKH
jgi:F-type H+-transporting ATPase subunit j